MTLSTVDRYGAAASGPLHWFRRAEAWLDDRGKPAWIAAMVLGFVFCWPVGLALLAYMIWSRRMFSCARRREGGQSRAFSATRFRSSGNTAFDAYKADTLDRLEREQEAFEGFLRRLRESKDKAEFDQYMEERARTARDEASRDDTLPATGA
ncbi:DUF2852 domain-containing protein [Frigidibacter sp. MR17.24]|uniref:DUF2852 domain-containing protein n=1 Tax=Frigidibacter sp. MR17.24 TaxID=3127345 RepID=UPI003012A3BF